MAALRLFALVVGAAAVAGVIQVAAVSPRPADEGPAVTVLVYHRFGPAVGDAMTVRTATFRSQLDYLKQHGHPVIPLRSLVSYLKGEGPAPSPRSVAITADDGHESVFREMFPLAREYRVPVTLFVYPSAISNAPYAMTWEQLDQLRRTGLFEIQSHTYWHPNFKVEKRRLAPAAYRDFATSQFDRARAVLARRLGANADFIAWPFGIEDEELEALARTAGHTAGFTIERRPARSGERIMALPRFLVTDGDSGRRFASILQDELR